jgi:hypothetical protein
MALLLVLYPRHDQGGITLPTPDTTSNSNPHLHLIRASRSREEWLELFHRPPRTSAAQGQLFNQSKQTTLSKIWNPAKDEAADSITLSAEIVTDFQKLRDSKERIIQQNQANRRDAAINRVDAVAWRTTGGWGWWRWGCRS